MAATFTHSTSTFKTRPFSGRSSKGASSYRPAKVTMFDTRTYWTSINREIETHLKEVVTIRDPLAVHEPFHHLVLGAPRTMAPALCVASCDLVGGRRTDSIPAASALHLMHAAAFTHDRMPNMLGKDGPGTYNANIELMSGDSIQPLGYELVARSVMDGGDDSARALRVMIEMTRMMGSQGIVEGQLRHVIWKKGLQPSDEVGPRDGWIPHVLEKKEGELYSCGAACGAILGGASNEEIERLRRFGFYAGMIYGVFYGIGRDEEGAGFNKMEAVNGYRELAALELGGINGGQVGPLSTLLDVCSSAEEENVSFV